MATMRPPRGTPETVVFAAQQRVREPLFKRLYATLRTTVLLVLLLSLFGYIGASLYWGATLADAPRTVTQVQPQVGLRYEDVRFHARGDSLTLSGWLFHADHPNGRSLIVVPDRKATRASTVSVGVAHDMLAHGYDVLLYDARGTGESDGSRGTLGNLEQHDLLGAYDYMVSRQYVAQRLVIFGEGTGGGAAILAAAQLPAVGAVVSDSAFASLQPLLDQWWGSTTHLPQNSDWLEMQIAKYLDVDPSLNPAAAANNLPTRAFLLFHDAADDQIPVAQARALKAASANPATQLVVTTPGSGHLSSYQGNPGAYMATMYAFVNQQIAAHGG